MVTERNVKSEIIYFCPYVAKKKKKKNETIAFVTLLICVSKTCSSQNHVHKKYYFRFITLEK
jgi:hypothetical protein